MVINEEMKTRAWSVMGLFLSEPFPERSRGIRSPVCSYVCIQIPSKEVVWAEFDVSRNVVIWNPTNWVWSRLHIKKWFLHFIIFLSLPEDITFSSLLLGRERNTDMREKHWLVASQIPWPGIELQEMMFQPTEPQQQGPFRHFQPKLEIISHFTKMSGLYSEAT